MRKTKNILLLVILFIIVGIQYSVKATNEANVDLKSISFEYDTVDTNETKTVPVNIDYTDSNKQVSYIELEFVAKYSDGSIQDATAKIENGKIDVSKFPKGLRYNLELVTFYDASNNKIKEYAAETSNLLKSSISIEADITLKSISFGYDTVDTNETKTVPVNIDYTDSDKQVSYIELEFVAKYSDGSIQDATAKIENGKIDISKFPKGLKYNLELVIFYNAKGNQIKQYAAETSNLLNSSISINTNAKDTTTSSKNSDKITTSTKQLPYTGKTYGIIISIIVIFIYGVTRYIKYKKMKGI